MNSHTPVQFSAADAARLAAATRQAERFDLDRYNGAPPWSWASQRSEHRHAWPIRITDTPYTGQPGLWPAILRYYVGYEGGVNTWADWPVDGECWAVPIPGTPDPEVGREYHAVLVGQAEGRAVLAISGELSESSSGGYYPEPSDTPCVIWYTTYERLAAVAVAVGMSLEPQQHIGYVGSSALGAGLRFGLGDGVPLLPAGQSVPEAGRTVPISTWFGDSIEGLHTNCASGTPSPAKFTGEELSVIHARFSSPLLEAAGVVVVLSNPANCWEDYDTVDLTRLPLGDNTLAGAKVYNAIGLLVSDVLTTVESVNYQSGLGFSVLLKHQTSDCQETGSGSNPYPGNSTLVNYPPPGIPYPYRSGYFSPVTRVCVGPADENTLIGRSAGNGELQILKIGPGLKLNNGTLVVDPDTIGDIAPTYLAKPLPITIERTEIGVQAGVFIGGTTCSPPSLTCCHGPMGPCNGAPGEPRLPVTIVGPFDAPILEGPSAGQCGQVELTGVIVWDDGQWRYEGFVNGPSGLIANVQMEPDGAGWVLVIQIKSIGEAVPLTYRVSLAIGPDGTTLVGGRQVVRTDCIGDMDVEVGNPCPGSNGGGSVDPGSGSGSSGGSEGANLPCSVRTPDTLPATLYYKLSATGLAACVDGLTGTMDKLVFPTDPITWYVNITSPCASEFGGTTSNGLWLKCYETLWKITFATSQVGCPLESGPTDYFATVSGTGTPFLVTYVVPACAFVDSTASPGDTITVTISENPIP